MNAERTYRGRRPNLIPLCGTSTGSPLSRLIRLCPISSLWPSIRSLDRLTRKKKTVRGLLCGVAHARENRANRVRQTSLSAFLADSLHSVAAVRDDIASLRYNKRRQ